MGMEQTYLLIKPSMQSKQNEKIVSPNGKNEKRVTTGQCLGRRGGLLCLWTVRVGTCNLCDESIQRCL